MKKIESGDFSNLATDYAKYRPGYSDLVVSFVLSACEKEVAEMDIADVGAGTGIFTRLLNGRKPNRIVAVEPNDRMREEGEKITDSNIEWIGMGAEQTSLPDNSMDLICMASSFHWPDTNKALKEFDRVLRDGGVFAAVWNPRVTERSEIETKIDELLVQKYKLQKRVSSGRSGITTELANILTNSGHFQKVAYCESLDVVDVPKVNYLGAWRSVNDIRSQLGEDNFIDFTQDIETMLGDIETIGVHYLTRAWVAVK